MSKLIERLLAFFETDVLRKAAKVVGRLQAEVDVLERANSKLAELEQEANEEARAAAQRAQAIFEEAVKNSKVAQAIRNVLGGE